MFLLAHMTSQNAPGYILADYYIWTVTAEMTDTTDAIKKMSFILN